jgi:hypothetical protein
MAARLRSTGRKSSSRRAAAVIAEAGNAEGMTVAVITTAPNAVAPPRRNEAEAPAQLPTRPAIANDAAPEIPTPAACHETARDCAVPSSGSAIALRPGM